MIYAVDLENNAENINLLKNFLAALDFLFSNDRAEIDRTTSNPARIVKLYGTMACKGDQTEDRPHRWSKIIKVPDQIELVDRNFFEAVAAQLPKVDEGTKKKRIGNKIDLDDWLNKNGITVAVKSPFHNEGTKFILEECPWNAEHTDRSAYIIQFNNGALAAGCHHNGCSGQNWSTLRNLYNETDLIIDESDEKETQTEKIIRLAENFNFFQNDLEEPYAAVMIDNHRVIMYVRSRFFKLHLTRLFFNETGTAPKKDSFSQALSVLEMKALVSGKQYRLHQRIAQKGKIFYYDLCDKEWRAVKISAKDCTIVTKPPILFDRKKNMQEQAEPDLAIMPKRLLKFVKNHFRFKNKNDRFLFTVYLVSSFIPEIAHPLLILFGEKGSAKSTMMRMFKRLVDPASQDLLSMPTSRQDLAILLANNYLPAFDNLDSISVEKSDMLCQAVTGGAFTKRKLYTDSEEIILRFKRCIVLNGINVVATRPDLLDRSIVLEVERIQKTERKTEDEIWQLFEVDIPLILGAIFNTISEAIILRKNVQLDEVGRMTDFTFWGYAIAEVLGIGGDSFINAYLNNQERANEEALNSNPVAAAVIEFMKEQNKWSWSVTELLNELDCVASLEHINTIVKTWPKDPSVLSRRLKEVKSNLEGIGIFFDIRHAGNFKEATIENRNVPPPEPPVPRHKKKR